MYSGEITPPEQDVSHVCFLDKSAASIIYDRLRYFDDFFFTFEIQEGYLSIPRILLWTALCLYFLCQLTFSSYLYLAYIRSIAQWID